MLEDGEPARDLEEGEGGGLRRVVPLAEGADGERAREHHKLPVGCVRSKTASDKREARVQPLHDVAELLQCPSQTGAAIWSSGPYLMSGLLLSML